MRINIWLVFAAKVGAGVMLVRCLRSSLKKSKLVAVTDPELKSPLSPFFLKGDFLSGSFPPLFGKEGQGRFSE